MGLSSWLQKLLDRAPSRRGRSRCAQDDFVHLFLTRLEDRRVLNADFSLVGADSLLLDNFTQTTDENLTIQDAGANYEFVLAEGVWNGTDGGGVTGEGTNTLSVDKSLIDNTIQIDDSADIDFDITFDTSDFSGLGSLQIAGAGAISQIADSTLQISTFDVDAAGLILDEATNDFGSVTLNVTGAAMLQDANDLTLESITTGDAFQVTTAGVLTLTGDINTDGTALTGDAPAGVTAGSVTINGNVLLGTDVTIDTDADVDGTLTVNGSLMGDGQSLTLELGSTDVSLTDPANDFGTLNITANNATIIDADDLQLGGSTLTNDLNITAGGAIAEAATPGVISTGGDLTLAANGNLGASGSALQVQVGGTASLTGNDIYITSDQDLVISHLETAASQADTVEISTTAGADLTLQVLAADFVNLDSDDITLDAAGTLIIQGDPLTAGTLNLTGGDVAVNADLNATTGAVFITANAVGGDVVLQDGTTINTTNANITIQAENDVQLSRIIAGGTNAASVTAGNAITDANPTAEGAGNENIVADTVILQAANGIGDSGSPTFGDGEDIDISANTLFANNTTSGAIQIFAVSDIALDQVSNPGRTVLIEATGAITDADPTAEGAGNENIIADTIFLQAANGIGDSGSPTFGDGEDIDISANTLFANNTTSGAIQIFAVGDIALDQVSNPGRTVLIEAGGAITDADPTAEGAGNENIIADTIFLQAANGIGDSGSPAFGDGEDIDISATTLFANNTTSGAVQIFAVGDLALDQVSNPGRTVLIEATGAITDSTPGDDSVPNIIADQAGLVAATGIGSSGAGDGADIDTEVGTLAAATDTGDINIEATAALIVGIVGGLEGLTITNADGVATGDDHITVVAPGTLTVNGAITNNDGGDVTLTAADAGDLLINADVQVIAPGNITLNGQNITLNSTGTASPTVEVIGSGTITSTTPQNGPITGTGIITVNAPGMVSINADSTLQTGGGVIQITTDDLLIDPAGLINADAANGGVVMIRNATAGREIELGGSGGGGVLNISDAELDRIAADSLRIGLLDGANDAGDITITATFSADPAMLSGVQLFSAGNITQNAGAGLSAGEIGIITSGGMVDLGNAANDAINLLAINAPGRIVFHDANSLTIGQVADAVDDALPADGEAGIAGVISSASYVELQAQNGALTVLDIAGVDSEISAADVNPDNNLAINLSSAGAGSAITINAGADVFSEAGSHRYTADNMDLQGTISASPADFSVSLRNSTAGVDIDLGSAGANAANNTLELSDAELDNITTNLLAIGRNTGNGTGDITITQAITPAGTSNLHLITPGTITDDGGSVEIANLFIEAGGDVILDNIAGNDVDTLAAVITNSGADLVFMDRDDLTVGTVNGLTVTDDANEAVGLGAQSGIDTNGGDVEIVSGSGVVVVSEIINTTGTVSGQDSGSITIAAQGAGAIQINADLITTGISAAVNGEGGDITLTTANGDIQIATVSLNAQGGGGGVVDGGTITLDANGATSDVNLNGTLTTSDVDDGTVRGSVNITADDAVFIGTDITTTGLGTVTITANDSSADGDDHGLLTMANGTAITAADGDVTLQTMTDSNDEATITVQDITTTGGDVLIAAGGVNADVILENTIRTGDGAVSVLADDTVTLRSSARIEALGTGDVLLRANNDGLDGDDNDEIFMRDGSLVNAGSGSVTLRTDGAGGGLISLSRVVTQNTTADAVTIISQTALVDAGDTGGADIEALTDAAATINITTATGQGTLSDAIETSGVRFNVDNTGQGVIHIANVTDSLDVVIDRLMTMGQPILFTNADADNLAPGSLTIASTGVASTSDGGTDNDVTITTDGVLDLNAPISTQGGTGGTFTVNGGITFTPAAEILLGTGDITLNTGALDIIVADDLAIDGPIELNAPRDIIINAALSNTTGDILLSADSDEDGEGGVVVRTAGQVDSAGTLTMEGSDVFANTSVTGSGILDAVHIEGDGNNIQAQSAGNLTIQNRNSASADADVVLAGVIQSTGGAIFITANNGNSSPVAGNQIHLAGDTTLTAAGNIEFAAPVVDDGDSSTASDLTLNTSATGRFLDRVGGGGADIDSLTTNAGGTTEILGGLVSTVNNQTYGDAVRIDDQVNFNSTTIAAGGNVLFQSTVDGLNADSADDLSLNVTGTTTFQGVVGGNQRIGDNAGTALTINSPGQTIFNAQVNTQSAIVQTDTAGRITFREDVDIDAGTSGNINSFFNGHVTLDGLTIFSDGHLTFGSETGGDDLRIEASSKLDTSNQSRNITINSNVSDPAGSNQNFVLDLNGGDLALNGSLGSAGNRLGNITVERANEFVFAPVGGQNLFAQSLTQQTGVDNSSGAARTILNGNINTSGAGVTLASTNVEFHGTVTALNAGNILTQAAGNITYTQTSTTTTRGGMIVSDAGGQLFMGEGSIGVATLDAGGGHVVLRAAENLTVSQIRTQGGYVGLISTNGAVIDGGDRAGFGGATIGTSDIQAAQLQIVAQTGIGANLVGNSPAVLETRVINLEASNGSNGIFIANTGPLTIGGVSGVSVQTFRQGAGTAIVLPSRNGIFNSGGDIDIATLGAMTVAEDVISQGTPGSIALTAASPAGDFQSLAGTTISTNTGGIAIAAGADATIAGRTATTNQGNINVFAANNALLTNSSSLTTTNGNIGVATGNDALLRGLVQTVNGSIGVEAGGDFQSIFATRIITDQGGITIAAGADARLAGLTSTTSQGNLNVFAGNNVLLSNTSVTTATNGTISVLSGNDTSFTGRAQVINGSILANAGGDFVLMDSTPAVPEVQVSGGQVIVVAQGSVLFMPQPGGTELPLVQSSTGSIRLPTPLVTNILTPQISTEGEAQLTFTIGVLGETNFTAIVDWGDGTATIERGPDGAGFVGGQSYTIFHTYASAPNPSNPAADIRVLFVVANDQNIHFFGNNNSLVDPALSPLQPPPNPPLPQVSGPLPIGFLLGPNTTPLLTVNDFVLQSLNPLDLNGRPLADFVDNLGVSSSVVAFPVPVSGFGSMPSMVIEQRLEIFLPGNTAEPLPIPTSDRTEDTSDFEFSGSENEDNREGDVQVLLRVLGPDGQKLFDQPIDPKYLQDPTPLWMKLPDGRYQIIVIEPGQTVGIVVRDVVLKQNRVVRRFDRFRPDPNEESGPQDPPAADAPLPETEAPAPAEPDRDFEEPEPEPDPDDLQADQFWEHWGRSKPASRFAQTDPQEETTEPTIAAAAIAGAVGLGIFKTRSRPGADSQMMHFSGRSLTPAARLRRRLRK